MSIYFVGSEMSWEDYLRDSSPNGSVADEIRNTSLAERRALSRQTREIVASRRALVRKFGSGFNSVRSTLDHGFSALESAIRDTQGSIEELRSSFDYHFAMVLEQMQLQTETTMNVLKKLESIHTTLENPLITQARELFRIGCDRLIKGLFDKSLDAFLDSASKDETNFMTQLMIGKLFLYGVNKECNVVDLDKAEQHLRAAARYAQASSKRLEEARRYAGEALLHAAIACYAQINKQIQGGDGTRAQRLIKDAYELASDSCKIYPELSEGHYQRAKFAALIGDGQTSITSLEKAIEIDGGYCEKVQQDQDFRELRQEIGDLFEKLRKKNESKINEKLKKCIQFLKEWHYPTLEAKSAKNEMKQLLHQVRALLSKKTYFDNRDALNMLLQVEDIFQSLLIHKFALHSLSAHVGRATCLAFNSNQVYLASGGADKTINIWRLPENQQIYTLRGHRESVTKLLFSQDGRALLSVDKAGGIRLWDVEDGTLLHEFVSQGSPVHCIAFSPDDTLLAVGCYDRQTRIWSMDDYSLRYTLSAHKSSVDTLVFNKSGKFLATGSPDNTATLWHVGLGEKIHTFYGCSGLTNSLAFSADGKSLITGLNDGSVKFYRIDSGAVVHELPPRPGAISWLSVSPDCKSLATINHGKALQLWDIESGKLIQNLKPFSPGISSVRFSPDGTILASSDYQDRSVKLWSVHDGRLMHVIAGNLTCSEFNPDGTYFVTGDETGSLKFWGRTIKKNTDDDDMNIDHSAFERVWKKETTNGVHDPGLNEKPAINTFAKEDINEQTVDENLLSSVSIEISTDETTENDFHDVTETETTAPSQRRAENVWEQVAMPEVAESSEAEVIADVVESEEQNKVSHIQNDDSNEDKQKIIDERIKAGKCYICGKPIGVIAKLAGIKLCYKHSISI